MKLSDFDFELPADRIATRPAVPRSAARLLLAQGDTITDLHVHDLTGLLRRGDLLVMNDTRVIPARLTGYRIRGEARAKIEVTLTAPATGGDWQAMVKPLRKLRLGEEIRFDDAFSAVVASIDAGIVTLAFDCKGGDFEAALARCGAMPLPPYIAAKRAPDQQDFSDYQTLWAAQSGAVAAPTASLHFDAPLLAALAEKGVETVHVTLHVGAGTFLPVKVDDILDHKMHSERGEITPEAAAKINAARVQGRRVLPVGTTALRLIESAATQDGIVQTFSGETDIFIYPGYRFRVTDGLMTNFHLPQSTLLMLVSALMGKDRMDKVYQHALAQGYRFFSYGDASLLLPDGSD